ncbi:MAG: serine/threonine protein kinase, partial [Nitrospinota bacterium]|nr:serine/threonine protein kinase [Nitrospinota bacterium]
METPKSLGRYEVLKELGRGGMGIVLKARDPRIDRLVALKIIKLDSFSDPKKKEEMLERFMVEAKAAGKLTHPNIVTVYDVGEEDE